MAAGDDCLSTELHAGSVVMSSTSSLYLLVDLVSFVFIERKVRLICSRVSECLGVEVKHVAT